MKRFYNWLVDWAEMLYEYRKGAKFNRNHY